MSRGISDIVNDDINLLTSARIPTRYGEFHLALYENSLDEKDHLALVHGDINSVDDVLVRVHSECFTGDVLGSLRCDCGEQLNSSMRMIAEEGTGIVLYLRQEGRGIGLHDKLRAYNLQDRGYDTVDANLALGHGADERDYTIGALILHDLGIQSVRLLTNNPEKIESLEAHGIEVAERVPLQPEPNVHNTDYLQTKLERMQHMLDLRPVRAGSSSALSSTQFTGLRRHLHHHMGSEDPFITLFVCRRIDSEVIEPSADSARLAASLSAYHDAVVAGSDQVELIVEALNTEGQKSTRLVVVDPDMETPIHLYRRAANVAQTTVFTATESATSLRAEVESQDLKVVGVNTSEAAKHMNAVLTWLADQNMESVFIYGYPAWYKFVLNQQRADYMIEYIDTASCRHGAGESPPAIPFSIEEPIRSISDAGMFISGFIKYHKD